MGRDTKQRLLNQGLDSFLTKGFNHTGIQEVLQATGVPKGSFYHYFKSKDDFGLQVVKLYAEQMMVKSKALFDDDTRSPLTRFRVFFEMGKSCMAENGFSGGCFIGNMSQEMGDLCPEFENILENKLRAMGEMFTTCLKQAREAGELNTDLDDAVLGHFIVNGWQGALLRMKVAKSAAPLEAFIQVLFTCVLV